MGENIGLMTDKELAMFICDKFCKPPVDTWEAGWVGNFDEENLDSVGLDGSFNILALAKAILEKLGAK